MVQIDEADVYRQIANDPMDRERNMPRLICCDYYWDRKRRLVVDLIKRHRARFAHDRLLIDLGCGYARDIWVINDTLALPDLRIACVDVSARNLELAEARKRYHAVDNVEFVRRDITHPLPWTDGEVDFVYASEIFEHIRDVDALIDEVARVLRPGGSLIVTTPNEPNLFQRSFYSRKRREEFVRRNREPVRFAEDGTPIYGHISIKKNREWDALMASRGLTLVDYRRGSTWFGGSAFYDTGPMLAALFGLNALLDVLPRRLTRGLSDQLIALYEKR